MIHEECKTCRYCAWVAIIRKKWQCECIRPKFWGVIDEDNEKCKNYSFCSWEKDD